MCDAVGGPDALEILDDSPLPDREFSWSGIANDVHERVGEVLNLCDQFCNDLLGTDYRTACRVFLAQVARGDPNIFRRKGRSNTGAAAVCWTVGKANELFSPGGMLVKDLMLYFDLAQGGVSQRAETMIRAAGYERPDGPGAINLGCKELLVSSRRRRIMMLRDLLLNRDLLDSSESLPFTDFHHVRNYEE